MTSLPFHRCPIRGPVALLAIVFAAASMATVARAEAACSAEVKAVDDQFRQAMISGDVDALDQLIADNAKIIHGNHGGVQNKRGLIDWFRSYHIRTYERTSILCHVDGSTAILVSATKKVAGSKETDSSTTEVFILRNGHWRLLVLQNTDRTPG